MLLIRGDHSQTEYRPRRRSISPSDLEMTMPLENFSLDVIKKTAAGNFHDSIPVIRKTVQLDTSQLGIATTVTFDGFTLAVKPFVSGTEVQFEFTLKKPGDPMNLGGDMGFVLFDVQAQNATNFRIIQLNWEINISSTEKLRITFQKP
jgi:hypothetical protein